jgi:outer membrane protein assembly factor BamB
MAAICVPLRCIEDAYMENRIFALFPVMLILAVADNSLSAEWPMHRGNAQRTGFYDDAAGYPKNNPIWTIKLGGPIVSSPIVQGGHIYLGCRDSSLYCLDTASGKQIWKAKTEGWIDASPLVDKGMVIVGSRDGSVYVFDKWNGDLLKRFRAGIQLSSAAVLNDGTLVCGMGPPDSGLGAFGKNLGSDSRPGWQVMFPQLSYSSPAIRGNRILVGASNGMLYGISTKSRKIMWTLPTQGGVYLSTPAIDDSVAYFAPGNYDQNVYAVNVDNGKSLWKSRGSPPAGLKKTGEEMLNPNTVTHLLRLSPQDRINTARTLRAAGYNVPDILVSGFGKTSSASPDEFFPFGGMKTSSVAVGPDNVYVVQKELGHPAPRFNLIALNRFSGDEQWRYRELADAEQLGYCSSPVITRNMVFVGWGEGHLSGFDRKKGTLVWRDTLQGHILSSPAIADAKLYIATMQGNVYCYTLIVTPPADDFKEGTYSYPNPARKGVAHIQVYVLRDAQMDMTIFNITEHPVLRVTQSIKGDSEYHDGKFTYDWDLKNIANGVYFVRIVVRYNDGGTDKKVLKIAVLK